MSFEPSQCELAEEVDLNYGTAESGYGSYGIAFPNPGLGQISKWAVKNSETLLLLISSISRSLKRWIYLRSEESQLVIKY